jgi:ABC-type proline/glycine betaine transport system substrate-binding protein
MAAKRPASRWLIPARQQGLDGSIAKAYEAKQPWVGYYWAPTALLGKYQMVKLGYGAEYNAEEWKRCTSVADCADPKENAWPADNVETLVTKTFADRAGPEVNWLPQQARLDQRHRQQADCLDVRQPGQRRGGCQVLPQEQCGPVDHMGVA